MIIYHESLTAWRCALIVVLFMLMHLPAESAIPDTIDYQGYLADSVGSPLNGDFNISFQLYNIESGGTALWSATQSVTVSNGLFNTKLGGVGSPFPVGLFDGPLWLGINVAGDGEMIPRIAMGSAAYAYKATDADTIASINPSSLVLTDDLANHTATTTAHHGKTTSFAELLDQAADAQIPLNILSDTQLGAHTADSAAHHARFTGSEALVAMGFKSDANPYNHDKRSDSQVFTAVTNQDGPGSTLDADLVDGLHASDIISAATDEIRIPITSLPMTINQPGSYYFTGDLKPADGSSGVQLSISQRITSQ